MKHIKNIVITAYLIALLLIPLIIAITVFHSYYIFVIVLICELAIGYILVNE